MNLCRLIYTSRAVTPIAPKSIKAIAEASANRNREFGITGILLATRNNYLQVLEGEIPAVNQVYRNIQGDVRHDEVILIDYRLIAESQFKEWAMKGTSTGLMGRILERKLREKFGEVENDLKIPLDAHMAFALLLDVYSFLKEKAQ